MRTYRAAVGTAMLTFVAPVNARSLLIVAAFGLAACAGDPSKVEENVFPADYKKVILNIVTYNQSLDPTNIREAGITDPVLRPIDNVQRYVVCVRFNPRNEKREYSGITERIAYFYQGHITQFVQANSEQCSWAQYKPFPELEKICLGDKCA